MTDQGSAPTPTPSTEAPATPLPGVYRVDPDQTVIRFRARSMFGLVPVKGTFTLGQGEFTVAEDVATSAIDASVLAESFNSGNAKRDEHIRSADYLEAAVHPEIRFHSTSIQRGSTDTAPGELTVHGVTQPCVLTVTSVVGDGKTVTAKATATIDRYAFGLTNQKGMVGRLGNLEIDVVAVRESDPAPATAQDPAATEADSAAEAPVETATEAPVETEAASGAASEAEPAPEAETSAEAAPGPASDAEAPAETPAEAAPKAPAEPSAEDAPSAAPDQPKD
ncbi:YceI family protein [Streptacidiphilus carbonis]|uniref:YceI family protein n=1 Tax=Streptacidiphilus carbonis TaxID=105422 RepID=UPI000693729D|nr:YceI family protein [Streptacidiphilus carbonis]